MTDWMLGCDEPGCAVKFMSDEEESLRGLGSLGLRIARDNAEIEGWACFDVGDAKFDYCPKHHPTTGQALSSSLTKDTNA